MKRVKYRIFCIALILILSCGSMEVLGQTAEPINYNSESAVRAGLNKSILLKQVENKLELSELKYDIYKNVGNQLVSGRDELGSGEGKLRKGLSDLDTAQDALNQAKLDILNGIMPQGAEKVVIVPNALVIEAGDDIVKKVTAFNTATGAGLNTDAILAKITTAVNKALAAKQKALDKGKVTYEENSSYLVNGKMDYKIAKAVVASALAEKLDVSSLNDFEAEYEANMLLEMAKAAKTVTTAAKGIYRNQLALMIQNSYYNVLKTQRLVEVKAHTLKRAETQLMNVKDGYDAGMKAKDDVLLASIYMTGAKLELKKAQDDYDTALIELKKNLGIPSDQAIILEDVKADKTVPIELEKGLESGMTNRLEIVKAEQQLSVYDKYFRLVKKGHSSSTRLFKEAVLLQDNAELELQKTKEDVECSIRQSYITMSSMESMLAEAKDMVEQARECLTIAQAKYKEGFGTDSALLKKLGIEAASGTMLEVISAEENLAQVEEKYVEVLYGYNLSKAKYLLDIGYLTY